MKSGRGDHGAELKEWFNPDFFAGIWRAGCTRSAPLWTPMPSPRRPPAIWIAICLTQRMTQTVVAARQHLPADYRAAVAVLKQVAPDYEGQFAGMFMSEFVATYGLDDRDHALSALACFPLFQLGIRRPALPARRLRPDDRRDAGLGGDPDPHVRRLASEEADRGFPGRST